ncbi:MAG: hybrid sensor histidine kinase/response regulator [Bacteroidetes bacterium]|nr:hybrid sensor histidine kinase/response regulator [Bacteroidota bacterium]
MDSIERKRILVIDDEDLIRTAISAILEGNGYEVEEAGSGEAGLLMISARRPDLVICDVNMEGLDGYGVLQELQKSPETASIPFMFLTGYSDHQHFRHGMMLGADDYLLKPITHTELLTAVEKRFERHSAIRAHSERKLDELRANISLALPHELRTPLHGILGFCKILLNEHATLSPADIADLAQRIHKAADRLQRLIENFLIYAQLEVIASDDRQLTELRNDRTDEPLQLIQLLGRMKAGQFQRLSDLTVRGENAAVTVSDRTLSKIVEELADNAFKFSEPGTPVTITVHAAGGKFIFIVADRGRGMSGIQMQELGAYMQFNRRVQEQQGSGLGLVIAKRLTELHLGELTVESSEGVGTTVRVVLPAPEPAA